MTTKIDGTNGIVFPDSTTQATAAYTFGVGQTWQNLTGSRSSGVTYTNSTGKPIYVSITIPASGSAGAISLTVNSIVVSTFNNANTSSIGTVSAIVPNGVSYSVSVGAGAISVWAELR